MIEAVNSAVANASLLRTNGDQSQQARLSSLATSSKSEDGVEFQLAPFVSPFIEIDTNFNKAVLQIRDSNTGEVQRQFPSETTMRARAAQAEIESQSVKRTESAPVTQTDTSSAEPRVSGIQTPSSNVQFSESPAPSTQSAQSQIASAAFAAGALSGAASQGGGVSVLA